MAKKITAKEKKARKSRRAFERICDRIEVGEKGESVREIVTSSQMDPRSSSNRSP